MGFFSAITKPFTSLVSDPLSEIVGGVTGATAAGEAAGQAAQLQAGTAEAGIEEQRRQFDLTQELLAPFVQAGTGAEGVGGALQAQQAILGLLGPEAQGTAVSGIESSPIFQALSRQGEESILQQASATGGLRGGNVQAALGQFSPQLLQQLIESQFGKLGGLTQLGQASAAGTGAAGQAAGANIADLLGQKGAAQAGGILAQGAVPAQTFQNLLGFGKLAAGAF